MSSFALSALEKDSFKESYIRNLHKYGYPATPKLMTKFNEKFCHAHGLQREKRHYVLAMLRNLNKGLRTKKNPGALLVSRKPELEGLFSAVVADCRQKRGVDREDESDREYGELIVDNKVVVNGGAILENGNEELAKTLKVKEEGQQLEEQVEQAKKSDVSKLEEEKRSLEEENRQLKEALQKKLDEQVDQMKKSVKLENGLAEDDENNDMEEEMGENQRAMAILEKRNEELAKALKMKDEECQQLEEEVRSLKEALQKKSVTVKPEEEMLMF